MRLANRFLILVAWLAALAGCAGPRYQTVQRYEPPADAAGQACVAVCGTALADCRGRCEAAWNSCAARVGPEVEGRYLDALKAYEADLRRYHRELRRYELDLWLGWDWAHWGYWGPWGHGRRDPWFRPWAYATWPGYIHPPAPVAEQPTRDTARRALLKERCEEDCGCQADYDRCFTGCGGRRVDETRCVANCPDGEAGGRAPPATPGP